uniref:PIG-P domain-containing protein n=1 Tax=Oryza punctata TaxID=4537 RepID=A0A0E0MAZ7_ORYPU
MQPDAAARSPGQTVRVRGRGRRPKVDPSRGSSEAYGFVESIAAVAAAAVYLAWAYLPEPWLGSLAVTYYPARSVPQPPWTAAVAICPSPIPLTIDAEC